jgi:hypothetical protein
MTQNSTKDENTMEADPAKDIERVSNYDLENKKSRFENDVEYKAKNSDNLFWIVVHGLMEKGYPIPNEKMIDIRVMEAGSVDKMHQFVSIKFQDQVVMIFDSELSVRVMIRGEVTVLEGSDAEKYRSKYYDYAQLFINEKDAILDSRSSFATTRLDRLGI